jgi:hypothetical protein
MQSVTNHRLEAIQDQRPSAKAAWSERLPHACVPGLAAPLPKSSRFLGRCRLRFAQRILAGAFGVAVDSAQSPDRQLKATGSLRFSHKPLWNPKQQRLSQV